MLYRDDRQVHARLFQHELVRHDRAGKWYLYRPGVARQRLTIQQAVDVALAWQDDGGHIYLGRPGGNRFDHLVSQALEAAK